MPLRSSNCWSSFACQVDGRIAVGSEEGILLRGRETRVLVGLILEKHYEVSTQGGLITRFEYLDAVRESCTSKALLRARLY
jgi:hypothetical protein